MKPAKLTPIILWNGDDELFTSMENVMSGELDSSLIPLLETTAVYRDLLFRDPEGKLLADPIQQKLVDRGYRCLTERLVQIEEPEIAILRISQINLMIRLCDAQA